MGIRRARRFLFLAAAVLLLHAPLPATSADLYALIYKGCANQSFPGGVAPPSVAALSTTLSAQSASAKFYKTSSSPSAASSSTSVFGLFQCRGDLSASNCAACNVPKEGGAEYGASIGNGSREGTDVCVLVHLNDLMDWSCFARSSGLRFHGTYLI